jgi:23S rRNA-/tRNA-specific pseudouridylate synthase
VHRLDRDTSGVLVVARTIPRRQHFRSRFAAAMRENLLGADQRRAQASSRNCQVALTKESGFGAHGRDEKHGRADEDSDEAKSATTHYAVMGRRRINMPGSRFVQ